MEDQNNPIGEGSAWLLQSGVVTKDAHIQLKQTLRESVVGVRHIDYFVDDTSLRVSVKLYLGTWRLIFINRMKLLNQVFELMKGLLPDYEIDISILRYKKDLDKTTQE